MLSPDAPKSHILPSTRNQALRDDTRNNETPETTSKHTKSNTLLDYFVKTTTGLNFLKPVHTATNKHTGMVIIIYTQTNQLHIWEFDIPTSLPPSSQSKKHASFGTRNTTPCTNHTITSHYHRQPLDNENSKLATCT